MTRALHVIPTKFTGLRVDVCLVFYPISFYIVFTCVQSAAFGNGTLEPRSVVFNKTGCKTAIIMYGGSPGSRCVVDKVGVGGGDVKNDGVLGTGGKSA